MKSINSLYSVKFSRNMTSKYAACKLKLYGHISVCVSNARFFSALTWNKSYSECRLLGCKRWVSFLPLSFSINFNYYNWSYVYDVCMLFVGCVFSIKHILGFNWIGCDWGGRADSMWSKPIPLNDMQLSAMKRKLIDLLPSRSNWFDFFTDSAIQRGTVLDTIDCTTSLFVFL